MGRKRQVAYKCGRCGHALADHEPGGLRRCRHGDGGESPCQCHAWVADGETGTADVSQAVPAVPERLEFLRVEDVIPTPENPRRIRPDDPAVAELAASIRELGLLQPVVVRPHPTEAGRWDLRAGARRYLAHRLLGRETILATVREMTDAQALEVTVLENLQRQDLRPLEEARGVRSLLLAGLSAEEAGRQIGKSARWVNSRALLTDLQEPWVTWFETQRLEADQDDDEPLGLTLRHLELLVQFPPEVQVRLAGEVGNQVWRLREGQFRKFSEWIGELTGRLTLAPWDLGEEFADGGSCRECAKRSARRQQWLFVPEGETPAASPDSDVCLDRECWQRREAVFMEREETRLRQEYPELILVRTDYYGAVKREYARLPVADQGSWSEARIVTKGTKGAVPALVVHGAGMGTLIWVVMRKSGAGARPQGPQTMAEKREQLEARRRMKAVQTWDRWLETPEALAAWQALSPVYAYGVVVAMGVNQPLNFREKTGWASWRKLIDGVDDGQARPEATLAQDLAALQRWQGQLWERVESLLHARLRVYGLPDVQGGGWNAHKEMHAQCKMLGQRGAEYDRQATAAIKEPKSWKDGAK